MQLHILEKEKDQHQLLLLIFTFTLRAIFVICRIIIKIINWYSSCRKSDDSVRGVSGWLRRRRQQAVMAAKLLR
jgi:hypothetical protein